MIPGEYRIKSGEIEINEGREIIELLVINKGDRPIQVGSHYHFYEVNASLYFDRQQAFGKRLNIAAGTAIRFEPGEEKPIMLVQFGGLQQVYGLNGLTDGIASKSKAVSQEQKQRLSKWMEEKPWLV